MTPDMESRNAVPGKNIRAGILMSVACLLGLTLSILAVVFDKSGARGVDYNQFYAASRLAGTGHLYDWDLLQKLERVNGVEVPTGRLPVVLYGHKLLGSLPYVVARAIWMAVSIVAFLIFAVIWPGARPQFMLLCLASSMVMGAVLLYGQDTPFLAMFFAAGLWLMERKRPWSAGVAFALCICKFHLAFGIPIMLLAQRRWRTLAGGAIAGLALLAACFSIEGPQWPVQYWRMSQLPEFSHSLERMPNLHGLACWLPWATATEIFGVAAIVWLLWRACRDNPDLGMAGAAAAACGVLVANHSYAGDCTMIIPLAVITIRRARTPRWLGIWGWALISPLPVLLLISRMPFLGQMLIVGFVVSAVYAIKADPGPGGNDGSEHGIPTSSALTGS